MQISKIAIKEGGLKGLEVEYLVWDKTKDGKPTKKIVIEKKQLPVHFSLADLISNLKRNLLEICRIIQYNTAEDEVKFMLLETEMTQIEFYGDSFALAGTILAFEEKPVKLKTPRVQDEDGYEKFGIVINSIREIIDETRKYLAGNALVTSTDITMQWIMSGKAGVSKADFEKLSKEEKIAFADEFVKNKYATNYTIEEAEVVDKKETLQGSEAEFFAPTSGSVTVGK